MRKCRFLMAAATALLIASATTTSAQFPTPEDMELNYSVTAGAMFPVNSDLNTNSSFIVGLSWYGPAGSNLGDNAALGLSGDWTQVTRFDGEDVNLVPVLLNYRRYGIIGGYRVFVTFGAGIEWASDDIPEMQLDDGFNFGWQAAIGVDVSNNVFGQMRFLGGSHPGDDGLAGVELGYRF